MKFRSNRESPTKSGLNTNKLKIIIATGIFPPDIGGPATYSKILSDELPKHGIQINVLSFGEVRHLPNVIRQIYYFLKVLRRGAAVDIIYAQDLISVGWPSFCANIFLRKKFIVKVVGDHVWEQATQRAGIKTALDNFSISFLKHPYFSFLRALQFRVARSASQVIVPSKYLKKIVASWGVSENKIIVIYNAFHLPDIFQDTAQKDKNTIISIGRLVPWKGFGALIKLMLELLKIDNSFKLKIIGSGPEEENLRGLIKKLDLEEKVTIKFLPHKEAMRELLRSGIFVLNTGYEGLSHTILEALSLSIPVVTTRIGGNPELITDSHNGLLVEYNNKEQLKEAVLKIYNNDELRKKFAENSKETLKKFTFDKMINDTIEVLNKSLN